MYRYPESFNNNWPELNYFVSFIHKFSQVGVKHMHEEINSKYTDFYRQINISKADFDRLKEKSEKDGEEQVITI